MARRPPQNVVEGFLNGASRLAHDLLKVKLVPTSLEGFARKLSAYGGYEGARASRVRDSWTTRNPGPNASTQAGAPNLVSRSRDQQRNDAHWAHWLELDSDEVVGSGIIPRAVAPDATAEMDPSKPLERTQLEKDADAAWAWWIRRGVADSEGRHTLYALTWVANMAWKRDGAVFMRRRWDLDPTRIVPLRVEILERDMLDESRVGSAPNGGEIKNGIQIGPTGRVEGYWFRKRHPSETGFNFTPESVFVPEADVIHLFKPLRAGQINGVPHGAPSMVRKRDLAQYESSELTRKDSESRAVAIVTPPPLAEVMSSAEVDDEEGGYIGITPTVVNARGEAVGDLQPGAVLTVEDGAQVNFHQPSATAGYPEYKKAQLREIAAGLNMTYEDLSGDLEGVTYTSYRAGHLKRHAHVDAERWLWLIPVMMDRLWDWCMEGAWLRGNVGSWDVPREWAPPIHVSVDPEKDTLADVLEERAGYALHDDKLATRGYNPAIFYARKRAENRSIDSSGGKFDTDGRYYSFRGAAPVQQGAQSPGSAGGLSIEGIAEVLCALEEQRPGFLKQLASAPLQGDGQ